MNRAFSKFVMWMVFITLLLVSAIQAQAAGERQWIKKYGHLYAGADYAKGMVIDKNDNVIVVGHSLGNASMYYDYAVVKYNSAGAQLWARRYNGGPSAYDEPFAVAVDGEGNIIVTGKGIGTRGVGLPDIVTVKYDQNGNLQWARRYYASAGGAHEVGNAVAVDAAGNIFVAGIASSKTNYQDAVLIKYSPSGHQDWVRIYDATFHDNDGYHAVAVDGAGNVIVTGFSYQSGLSFADFLTVKYNTTGTLLWLRTYDDEEGLDDWAEAIAIDKQNNIVVTGSRGESCDSDVGYCFSYATIKYSPGGVKQWVAAYNPQPTSDDLAHAVKVDATGNVYVTGESSWASAFYDIATVKYSPAGKQLWAKRHDGFGHGNDKAYGLAIDSKGSVIVAGHTYVSLTADSDFTVVKYSPAGAKLWVRTYNGQGSGIDMAFFVAVDSADNVYASGFSTGGSTTAEDFVTIKYAP